MDIKEIIAKILDEQGVKDLVLIEVLDGKVKAKLDELVADSANALDDAILAMIYPIIREEISKQLDKLFGIES